MKQLYTLLNIDAGEDCGQCNMENSDCFRLVEDKINRLSSLLEKGTTT